MNYGEIKAQIKEWSHRTDLDQKIPEFINNTSQRLGRRFGVMPYPLVLDTDTNSLLKVHSNLYLYGALREMMVFTENAPGAQAYEFLYQGEVKEMNINYRGLDWAACPGPVMRSAKQQACYNQTVGNDNE